MSKIGIIPARYNSSRFEGKPLANIKGKPMLWHVYNNAIKAKGLDYVVVAIDNDRIKRVCDYYKINYIMTSKKHETGLDRVAEVAKLIHADNYIIIMGDEPLLKPKDIEKIIDNINNEQVVLAISEFKNSVDVVNWTNIKIVLNDDDYVMYMSRNPIPYPKSNVDYSFYKQVGIMGFKKDALLDYTTENRSKLEKIEDIEQLRFLNMNIKIKAIKINTDAMSVDTPKDVIRIKKMMED